MRTGSASQLFFPNIHANQSAGWTLLGDFVPTHRSIHKLIDSFFISLHRGFLTPESHYNALNILNQRRNTQSKLSSPPTDQQIATRNQSFMTTRPKSLESLCFFQLDPVYQLHWTMEQMLDTIVLEIGSKDPNELKQACRKSNASLFFKITQPIPGGLFIPYLFPQRVQEKPRVYREPISVDPSPQSQVKTRESTRLEEAQNSLEEQHNTERTEKHHTPFVPSQLTPPAKLNLSKLKLPTAPSSRPSQKSSSTYPRLLDHVKQLTKPTPAQLEQHKLDPHRSIMNSFRANNANVYLSSLVFFEEFFRLHMSKGEDATESQDSNPPDNQMSLTHSLFFLLSCLSSLSHSAQRHAVHEFHLELRDYSSGVNRSCLQNQIGNPNLKQTGLVKETARMVFEMEEAELVEKDNRMILERDHVDRSRNHSWTTGGSLKRNDLGRAIDANLFEVAESRIDRLEAEWQKEIAKKDRRSWHRITRRSFFQIVRTITPRFKPAQAPKPRLDTLQDPSHQTVRDPSQQTQQSPPEAPHKVDAHVLMRDLEDYIQNTSHPDEDIARMGEWVDAHRACDAMTQIMRLEYELEMRSLWVMSLLQRNAALPSLPRDSITDLPVTLTYSTQPKFSVPLDSLHVGGLILHPVSCQLTLPSSTDFTASILQSDGLTQDSLASLLSSLKVPSITVTFFSPHFRTIFRNAWRTFFCTDNTFFTTDLGKELFPPVAAPAEPQRPPSNSFFSQAILPDKHDPHPYKFEQTRNFPSRTGVKNFSPFFRILECDFPFTSPEMFIEFMSFFSFVYVQTEADDPNKFLTFVLPLSSLIAPDKPGYSFFPIGSTSSGLAVFHPPNQQRFEMEQPQTQEPVPEALSSQSWMDKINNDDDTKTSSSPLSAKTDGDNSISRGQPIFTPSTVLAHPHKRETSLHLAQEVPSDCEGWKQMRRQIHSFYGAKHSPPFSPTSYHDSENWIVFYFSDEHLSKDYAQLEQIEREYVTGPERERGLSLDKLIERSRQKMIDLQHRTKNMFVIPSEFVYLLLKHHIFLMLRDFLHLFPPFHSTYHRVLSFFFSSPFNPSLPSTFPFRLITEDWMAWLMKGPMYLRIATPPTQTILEKKQARFSSKPSLLSLQNSLPAVRLHVSHSVSFDLWSASFRRKTPPQPVRPNGDQKRPDAPSTSLTPLFPYPPPPEEPKAKTLCDILISPSIAKDLKRPSELLPSSPMIPIIFRRQHSLVRFFGRDEDDTLAVYPPGSNCVDQMNVTAFDAFRLNQGRFINDNILSFYTRLLNDLLIVDERGTKWEWNQNSADSSSPLHFNNPMQLLPLAQKRRREELSNRFYFFNTFFYRYLRNGQTAWHRLVESHARNSQRESASAKHKEKKGEPVGFIQTLFGNLLSKRPKEFSNHVRREIDGGGGDEMLRDDSSPDPPSRSSHNGTTTLPSGRLPHPQFTPPTLSRPARTPLFSPNDPSHSTPNHLSLLETMKVITPGELSNEDSESDSEGFDRDEFLQNLDREMPLFSQPSTQPENDDNMSEPDVMSQGDFFSNTYDAETPTPIELKPDWDESEDDKRRQRGHTELLPEEEEFIPPSLSPRLPFSYSVPYIGEKTVWQSSPSLDQLPLHRRMIRVYEEMHHTFSEIPPTSLFGPLQPSSHQTDTNTNGCADFYASEFHRNLFYPFTDPFSHDARSEQPAFSLSTPLTSDSTFFLPLLLPFSTFSRSIQKDPPKSLLPTSLQSVSVDPVTLIPRVPNSLKHTLAPFPPEHLFSKVEDLSSYNSVRMWTRHNDLFTKQTIFLPINEDSHWSLIIITNPGMVLDSTPFLMENSNGNISDTSSIWVEMMKDYLDIPPQPAEVREDRHNDATPPDEVEDAVVFPRRSTRIRKMTGFSDTHISNRLPEESSEDSEDEKPPSLPPPIIQKQKRNKSTVSVPHKPPPVLPPPPDPIALHPMPSPPAPPILMPSPPAPPIVMPSPPAPPILMPVIRRSTRSSAITSATLPIMPSLPTTPEAPVQERSHSMTPDSMFSPELPDHPDLQTDDTKIAEIREHMQAFPWLHDVFFNIGTGTEFYLFLDTHSFLPQEGRVSLLSDEPVSNPVSTVRKMLGTIDRFRDNWRGSTTELIKDVNHLISRRITELKSEQNEIKLKYKTGWIPPKQDSPVVQHEEEMLVDKVEHTPQSSSPVVQRVEETPTDTIEHMPQSSQPSNAVILREPSLRIRPPVKHSPPRLKQIFQESFQTKIERATSKEHAKTTSIEIRNERKPRQQLPTHESENESDQGLSPVMEIVDGDLDQKRLFGDDRTEQENEQTSLSLNQMRRNVDGGGPHEHDEKQTKKVQVSVGPLKLPQKSPMKSLVSPVDMQTRQRRNLEASDFQRQWNRSIRENRKKNLTKLSERTPQKSPQQQRQREPFALPDPQVSPETPRRVERVEVQPYAVAFGDEEEEVEEPEMNEGMCLTIQPDLDFPPSFPIQSMEAMIRSPCRLPTIPPCPQPVRSDPEPFFPYFYSLPKVPSMLIVDSYPTSSICKNYSSHAHLIWHYLSLEAFYRKGLVYGIEPGKFTGSTMGVFVVPAPKQKNTFDCGVYVMKGIREYAMQVVRKDKVKALGESDDEEEWRDTRLKREGKQIDVGQTIQTFIDDKVCIVDGIDYTLRFIIDSPESFPVRGSANPKNDSKDKARNTAASSVRQTPQPSMESTPAKHPSVSSVQSSPLQHPVPPSSLDFNLPQLAPFRMSRAGTREDPSTAKSPPTDDGWFSLRSMCLFRFALEDVVFLLNSLLLEVNGGDRDFRVWHQEHNDDEGVPLVLDLFQQQYAMFGKICGFTDNGRELCGYVIRDDVLNTWN